MQSALAEAFTTGERGLKVVVAEGECQLERQRRLQGWLARRQAAGDRVERVRYGIDEEICTGDRACVRLSGCPSLTLRDSANPLRTDPVTTVDATCVGCGLWRACRPRRCVPVLPGPGGSRRCLGTPAAKPRRAMRAPA
jgi:indolepyruvate ferredoxin oxidoreductase alpha subunit